jgi:hypothetical protein
MGDLTFQDAGDGLFVAMVDEKPVRAVIRQAVSVQAEAMVLRAAPKALPGRARAGAHAARLVARVRAMRGLHEPGVSGGVPFQVRPAGGRLWAELQRGDTLAAWKLDRVFRSASDCLKRG